MKTVLLDAYNKLCRSAGVEKKDNQKDITLGIRNLLKDFLLRCENPAIWCNGEHTQMLMADFVAELKKVRYIIDDYCDVIKEGGYKIIRSSEIAKYNIDGVVISSYRHKCNISRTIERKFPKVKYLDIYAGLEREKIFCSGEYYLSDHPYKKYKRINELLHQQTDEKALFALIQQLISIKDFKLAGNYIKEYKRRFGSNECICEIGILNEKIIDLTKDSIRRLSRSNILLLCFDSLRQKDLKSNLMPGLRAFIDQNMESYENAYSISTSTCESLIPALSENYDLKSKYYEKNRIDKDGCRFINEALRQGKKIFFYTDAEFLIDNPEIKYSGRLQTASEKLWDFVIDSSDMENGLFYVHILYESHFSFANPYTKTELYSNGTSLFFDFLEKNGGKLKTDYELQHKEALNYLDDLLKDFMQELEIPMVIFADHGISILPQNSQLKDIHPAMLVCEDSMIHIPFAYWNGEKMPQKIDTLFSLGEINEVIVSLMSGFKYEFPKVQFVKIQRSRIYNPDYRYIYKKLEFEKGELAFEAFIFEDRRKLVIYENGISDLYDEKEEMIHDVSLKKVLLHEVINKVTVCERELIFHVCD